MCEFCDGLITSSNQYQRHIGQHLEQLALFALPTDYDTEDSGEMEREDIDNSSEAESISSDSDNSLSRPPDEQDLETKRDDHLASSTSLGGDLGVDIRRNMARAKEGTVTVERLSRELEELIKNTEVEHAKAIAEGIAKAERDARDTGRKSDEERKKKEAETAALAVAQAQARLEAAIRANDEAEAPMRKKKKAAKEAELRERLKAEVKLELEIETRKKVEKEMKDAERKTDEERKKKEAKHAALAEGVEKKAAEEAGLLLLDRHSSQN